MDGEVWTQEDWEIIYSHAVFCARVSVFGLLQEEAPRWCGNHLSLQFYFSLSMNWVMASYCDRFFIIPPVRGAHVVKLVFSQILQFNGNIILKKL